MRFTCFGLLGHNTLWILFWPKPETTTIFGDTVLLICSPIEMIWQNNWNKRFFFWVPSKTHFPFHAIVHQKLWLAPYNHPDTKMFWKLKKTSKLMMMNKYKKVLILINRSQNDKYDFWFKTFLGFSKGTSRKVTVTEKKKNPLISSASRKGTRGLTCKKTHPLLLLYCI